MNRIREELRMLVIEVTEGHQKLLSFGQVKGLVFGNFGEASEATHKLINTIATSRVRVAFPQSYKAIHR